MGRSELAALVSALVSPLGICFGLFCLALGLYRLKKDYSLGLVLLSLSLLWLSSMPMTANILARFMERDYPPSDAVALPVADAIIVLGGGVRKPSVTAGNPELNEAGDRLVHAHRLFTLGKAPLIIATGGQVFEDAQSLPEAEYMRDLLVQFGVPSDRILLEPNSRNTYENAMQTLLLLNQKYLSESSDIVSDLTFLLVTSAAHMERARLTFEDAGLKVIPAPTDYQGQNPLAAPYPYLLDTGALFLTTAMLREWWARFAYREATLFNRVELKRGVQEAS